MSELLDNEFNETQETFVATGEAPDVLTADREAWEALESCLGLDPAKAWRLVSMQHAYQGRGRIAWGATFERDQTVAAPRSQAEADYLAGEDQEVEA